MKKNRKFMILAGLVLGFAVLVLAVSCAEDDEETPPPPAPTFAVVSPNGGEVWGIGVVDTIKWTSTNHTGNVKIEANYAYGTSQTWTTLATVADAAPKSYAWTVPDQVTTTARVRVVSATTATAGDTSNANFTCTKCVTDCGQAVPIVVGTSMDVCALTTTGADTLKIFRVTLANGNYRFRLSGPQGSDFDVYACPSCDCAAWTIALYATGNEDSTVAVNAGTYYVWVDQAAGSGNFELLITQAGPEVSAPPVSDEPVAVSDKRPAAAPGARH